MDKDTKPGVITTQDFLP